MIENHPIRAGEGEVEPNRWRWLLVRTSKPNIVEFDISSKINMCDVLQGNLVIEMRVLGLIIHLEYPTITITMYT